MNKTKEIWIAVAVVVVVVVVYFGVKSFGGFSGSNVPTGPVGTQTDQGTVTPTGVQAAAGTSVVSSTGAVVTTQGQVTQNNVAPASPTAPQQSNPVDASALPSKSIKLTITTSAGWTPNAFTVSAGAPVTIAVTSGDDQTHVLLFDDSSLSAVAVGVGPGETRAITFNAPTKAGAYTFHSDVPGQKGLTGTMTVK